MTFANDEQEDWEATFLDSWNHMEAIIVEIQSSSKSLFYNDALTLIRLLRPRGFDRSFRARLNNGWFIVSRSIDSVTRPDQPFMRFSEFNNGEMQVEFSAIGTLVSWKVDRLEITSEVEDLLAVLMAYPID